MPQISLELLTERTAKMNADMERDQIDPVAWLELLSPVHAPEFPFDSVGEVSVEEHNRIFEEWEEYYEENYQPARENLLNKIFETLEDSVSEMADTGSLSIRLLDYAHHRKAGEILQQVNLAPAVKHLIGMMGDADEKTRNQAFDQLYGLQLEDNQWNERGLTALSADLVDRMQQALTTDTEIYDPRMKVFFIVKQLASAIPQELSRLAGAMVDNTSPGKLGFRTYGSLLFVYEKIWEHLAPYWPAEAIAALRQHLSETARSKFKKGDAFVADTVYPALRIVGKGDPDSEATLAWVESKM